MRTMLSPRDLVDGSPPRSAPRADGKPRPAPGAYPHIPSGMSPPLFPLLPGTSRPLPQAPARGQHAPSRGTRLRLVVFQDVSQATGSRGSSGDDRGRDGDDVGHDGDGRPSHGRPSDHHPSRPHGHRCPAYPIRRRRGAWETTRRRVLRPDPAEAAAPGCRVRGPEVRSGTFRRVACGASTAERIQSHRLAQTGAAKRPPSTNAETAPRAANTAATRARGYSRRGVRNEGKQGQASQHSADLGCFVTSSERRLS